jgi:hypothetical protein
MKLKQAGSNMTELFVNGHIILFSYETPVAANLWGGGYVRTSTHYSPTTSRHINKWLDGRTAPEVSQAEIDALLNNRGE